MGNTYLGTVKTHWIDDNWGALDDTENENSYIGLGKYFLSPFRVS